MLYDEIRFEKMTEKDLKLLSPIMKNAYDKDTLEFLGEDKGGPRGYDDGSLLRKYLLDDKYMSYTISIDGRALGAVVVILGSDGLNYLENIFTDPLYQDKGLGSHTWNFLLKTFPNTITWQTETPGYSKRNHNFYINKCGFHLIAIKNPKDKYSETYVLEKKIEKDESYDL